MYSETGGTTKKRADKESGSGQYGSVVCRVATASDEESTEKEDVYASGTIVPVRRKKHLKAPSRGASPRGDKGNPRVGNRSQSYSPPPRSRATSRAALAFTDKPLGLEERLSNICSKGSIIPVSFLNLNYMPADCLLGSEKDENDIFTEICGCQPIRGNRELQNVSELNNSVTNLMKSLAFHRARQKEVPMNAKEVEQNRRIVSELTTSIRTILQV